MLYEKKLYYLSLPDCIHAQRYCVKVELWKKTLVIFMCVSKINLLR